MSSKVRYVEVLGALRETEGKPHPLRAKWQVVISAKIPRKLGIKPGTKICFVEREHDVLFQPLTKEHIRNLAGILKSSTSATAELLKERKLDKEREDNKFARRRAR